MKISKKYLINLITETINEQSEASKEAKTMSLKHVGFGNYANSSGKVVAKSVDGKLVSTLKTLPSGGGKMFKTKSGEHIAVPNKNADYSEKPDGKNHRKLADFMHDKLTLGSGNISEKSYKDRTRRRLDKEGIKVSDEEFDKAFNYMLKKYQQYGH